MSIGYQGEYGSNAERAARLLADQSGMRDCELVACRTSAGVVERLLDGRIDFGVYAVENSYGGKVEETKRAVEGAPLRECARLALPVEHCLFAIDARPLEEIKKIFSHPQALKQCAQSIRTHCPDAAVFEADDAAGAAYLLSSRAYGEDAAVICPRVAGDRAGLALLREGFQDRTDNLTTFVLVQRDVAARDLPPVASERVTAFAMSPKAAEHGVKLLIILTIFAAFWIRDYAGWSSWDSALAVSGIAAAMVLFLGSRRLENWAHRRAIAGYWKYELVPTAVDKPATQAHLLFRLVHIDAADDGGLRLRGWREGDGSSHRWENKEVLISRPGTRKGRLLYEYTNTHDHPDDPSLDGVVHLSWNRTHPARRITRMSGWYTGFATGDVGRIRYERIDKTTFDRLRAPRRH